MAKIKFPSVNPVMFLMWAIIALLLFIVVSEPCKNLSINCAFSEMKSDIYNVLQVFAAGIMAWFTISLARLANSAEKTSKQELRAYICLSSTDIKVNGGTVNINLKFVNFGQTPAYEPAWAIAVEDLDGEIKEGEILPPINWNSGPMHIAIAPGKDIETKIIRYPKPRPDWEGPDKIRARYFYGTLRYRDIFNDFHETNVCWVWTPYLSQDGLAWNTDHIRQSNDWKRDT
jgi:hypothetical protein